MPRVITRPCPPCNSLIAQGAAKEPHPDLKLDEIKPKSDGAWEYWHCDRCGSVFHRNHTRAANGPHMGTWNIQLG